jgi:L-rhamnonate dehydratase
MGLMGRKIKAIRAYVVEGGGADYHDQSADHWIVKQIATPMSIYSEYKATRTSFGINALKTLVVEVEADNGVTGFGITTGGYPAAWLVMNHLDRFVVGKDANSIEIIWDQMYRASLYYGRKGIVMNAISAIDLALWDLLGRLREEPVYAMLGGKVREELTFYATGPRPDLAKGMGFVGGKIPLVYGQADGNEGLRKNIETLKTMRERVGDDFLLMWDCWMALDLPYAKKLMTESAEYGLQWMEECFNPDDYWSYRDLKKCAPNKMWVTGGEHEASRYGFRALIEECDLDVIQPDVGWCGGLTELIKIGNLADAHGKLVIPHGSGVYSYHYVTTKVNSPITECLMMAPQADKVVPQYYPLIKDEPMPVNGKLKVSDKPGFGVELNKDKTLVEVKKGTHL